MATDLRGINKFPHCAVIAATTNAHEIKLPSQAAQVTIGCQTAICLFGQNNQTDATSMGAANMFVPSGNILTVKIGRGTSRAESVFVAMPTGTGNISVILEEL